MSASQTDDQLLATAGSTGDRVAIDELIRRYCNFVHGIAVRQTGDPQLALDVSQAVFLVFIRRIGSIHSARALPNWFLQVTRNAAREARRTADRRSRHERSAAKPESAMSCPEIADNEKLALIDEAIAALRHSDRELILMRYMQNRDVQSISAALGIGEDTVRKRITRAIDRTRRWIARRGVIAPATTISALLILAASHAAPAAVVHAFTTTSAGNIPAPAAALTKRVLKHMLISKIRIAASFALAAVAAGAVATTLIHPALAVTDAPTSQPAAAAVMTPAQAKIELDKEYALKPGEILRLIDAPFSPARTVWADDACNCPGKSNEAVPSIGFGWSGNSLLGHYLSGRAEAVDQIIQLGLKIDWYNVEGTDDIDWVPFHGDVVVREDASTAQKLDALAEIIKQRTGQDFEVVQSKSTRSCIVLHDGTTASGFPANVDHGGGPTVVFTTTPWTEELQQRWINWTEHRWARNQDKEFRGTDVEGGLQYATLFLGSPYFHISSEPVPERCLEPMWANTGELRNIRQYVIARDAHLDPSAADYRKKLQVVLDNLKKQIGGDWKIEPREITLYTFHPIGP